MIGEEERQQESHRIVIDNEMTIYTAAEMKDKLLTYLSATDELELELTGVSEIDASGLQLLVMIKREATVSGKVLRFVGHSPAVLDILNLSCLAGFFGDPLLIVGGTSA